MTKQLSSSIIVAMSVAWLWHFSNIWRYGEYLAQEPNLVLLAGEIVLLTAILTWAIVQFIKGLKEL